MNIFTCILVGISSICFLELAKVFTNYYNFHGFNNKQNNVDLFIGIMSARNDFEERESIRNTWLHSITYYLPKIEYKFLVGLNFCVFHPDDRVSEFSCEEWKISLPNGLKENTEFQSNHFNEAKYKELQKTDIGLQIHHPIVVRRLCILSLGLANSEARVSLINAATNEKIISATFIEANSSETLICKSVEAFVFPKDFEGRLSISGPGSNLEGESTRDCNYFVDDNIGVVTYSSSFPGHALNNTCTPVSMIYSIHDSTSLLNHVKEKSVRQTKWLKNQQNIEVQLQTEHTKFGDILFLDVIDVYRNLPLKLLKFLQWTSSNVDFQYVLKTDDDTFINIDKVVKDLKSQQNDSDSKWWWSIFRERWPVQEWGKWREKDYHSSTYPPFPCGAGYVLSAGLVHYLALNADQLHVFQGEDTSLGIWLAPLRPTPRSNCWECSSCVPGACNRPQLSVQQMYNAWDFFRKCGDFCTCD